MRATACMPEIHDCLQADSSSYKDPSSSEEDAPSVQVQQRKWAQRLRNVQTQQQIIEDSSAGLKSSVLNVEWHGLVSSGHFVLGHVSIMEDAHLANKHTASIHATNSAPSTASRPSSSLSFNAAANSNCRGQTKISFSWDAVYTYLVEQLLIAGLQAGDIWSLRMYHKAGEYELFLRQARSEGEINHGSMPIIAVNNILNMSGSNCAVLIEVLAQN